MLLEAYVLCFILFLANLVIDIDYLNNVSYEFGTGEK